MLRLITCQHATFLLEQRAAGAVPRGERANLWLHLRYCRHCSRYARQTQLIADWARAAAAAPAGPGLPAAAKERMRQRLAAAG